jgi:polyphosphate kinase 2 (PPK2 family)
VVKCHGARRSIVDPRRFSKCPGCRQSARCRLAGSRQGLQSRDLSAPKPELKRKQYEEQIAKFHAELVKLQFWVKRTGARIVVVFEGKDAAGKGGVIKRITDRVSPRIFRVVALPAPSERERSQIYFQRSPRQPSDRGVEHRLPPTGGI